MFRPEINTGAKPVLTNTQQTVAARLKGGENKINAILVADLDMIHETFFNLREQGELDFDNVTFVLNAVDSLAGDDSLVSLRTRRREFRTLERVEAIRTDLTQITLVARKQAEEAAEQQLAEAQKRMTTRIDEIEKKQDLDENAKAVLIETVRQSEQRKLDTQSRAITDERLRKTKDAQLDAKTKIEKTQMTIRLGAVLLPPIPAIALGAMVFIRRRARETQVYATQEKA